MVQQWRLHLGGTTCLRPFQAISKGLTVKSLPNGSGALPQTECLNKGLISLIGGFNPSEKY